jgi:hypothetical protein
MRVLVCGGRDYKDKAFLDAKLSALNEETPFFVLIQGGAGGADYFARNWGWDNDIDVMHFKADWNKYGRAAGPIRNQQMLDEGKPDLVLAFPGGRGTAHMIRIAREAGVEVIEVPV